MIKFKQQSLLMLIALFILSSASTLSAQCNCDFEYDFSVTDVTFGQVFEITLDINTNGVYQIAGDNFYQDDYEVCDPIYSEAYPIIFDELYGSGYSISITDVATGCTETIDYNLPYGGSDAVITSGSDSCEEGCTAHACDLSFTVYNSLAYVYAYPHQGELHRIRFRPVGNTNWVYFLPTTSHYNAITLNSNCITYEAQIKAKCDGPGWTQWSSSAYFTGGGSCRVSTESTDDITVYPNPATTQISVDYQALIDEAKIISLTSIQGKESKIIQADGSGLQHIDIADLPQGIYILQIDNYVVKKIIKQ